MTMMDIGQFPKIDSEPQDFKLKWYETKLIYPFKYSEGVHYFIQKDQEWIIDEIAKWVKEEHFKEAPFPSVIDWKLKLTYQSFRDRIPWENPGHSATLTCENRQNAKFKFGFMTVFPNTSIELYYDGDRIDEVNFCLFNIADSSGMMLIIEEEWVYLLATASRLFT
jgi:hypothetical protein